MFLFENSFGNAQIFLDAQHRRPPQPPPDVLPQHDVIIEDPVEVCDITVRLYII